MIIYKTIPDNFPCGGSAVSLGLFDGLHLGHFAVLNAMRSAADGLATAVFTFSTAMSRPSSKPDLRLMSLESRDALLSGFGVDYVVEPEFESIRDMSPQEFAKDVLMEKLKAKKIFCGEDFRFGKNAAANADDLCGLLSSCANPPELVAVPVLREGGKPVSSTRIRRLIQSGDIKRANALLGRPFSIDFAVGHGRKLGRTLGLPTINQAFPGGFTVPKFGVYASVTTLRGVEHMSVTNVGVKPTVGSSHILAETYIHGFSGELYGERVPVRLMEFIRSEKKFASVEELKGQIEEDNRIAAKILGGDK